MQISKGIAWKASIATTISIIPIYHGCSHIPRETQAMGYRKERQTIKNKTAVAPTESKVVE